MKKIVYTLIAMIFIFFGCERTNPVEIVNIPDDEFFRYLLSLGIDTDEDYTISYAEAEVVTKIDIGREKYRVKKKGSFPVEPIRSLKGIEAFINLDTLICSHNEISVLDLSQNAALTYLDVSENDLTSLNVSNNIELTHLVCGWNQITSLDVSNNTVLTSLNCGGNQLTSLDVSKNTALIAVSCTSNELTTLDISNNSALEHLNIKYMPTLTQVCVWTMPFPPDGLEVNTSGSPNVYFTTDCSD